MSLAEYALAKSKLGQRRVACPACAPNRKTKGEITLSLNDDGTRVAWHCWHCGEKGATKKLTTHNDNRREQPVSQAVVPLRTFQTEALNEQAIQYLESRGISAEVARMAGVVSGTKFFRKPNMEMQSIGFVYNHKDNDYAIKWRSIQSKNHTQDGSCQTLYLANKIATANTLVITEGEIDALSFWQVGIEAVSIPSGAIEQGVQDDAARLKWMAHHDDLLGNVSNVFLAVDMDGPGQTTANELARRIGKMKCWKVVFPPGCKDANDTLVQHGKDKLVECITNATQWPIEGLASANDYLEKVMSLYQRGLPRGFSTGWQSVDEIYTLNPGNLVIVTGIPGHGKSTFLDALLVNAMKDHDWRIAYASFENPPEIHLSKLIAQKVGMPFGLGPNARMTEQEMLDAMSWVNDHVTFLTHDGVMPTVQSLIERFETTIRRSGVKACVVDPFNFLKLSSKKEGGIDTEAINEMLSEFKMFAQRAEVVFFLVAHPAKPMGGNADFIPTGYSISGSAHFYNRCDFGLTVHRKDGLSNLHVWKARFAHQGKIGQAPLVYNGLTGGFSEYTQAPSGPTEWDWEGKDDSTPF